MLVAPHTLAFLSSTPGGGELLVLFLAILILFGPRRLPEVARTVGKFMEYLRRASQDFRDQVMQIEQEADDIVVEAFETGDEADDRWMDETPGGDGDEAEDRWTDQAPGGDEAAPGQAPDADAAGDAGARDGEREPT